MEIKLGLGNYHCGVVSSGEKKGILIKPHNDVKRNVGDESLEHNGKHILNKSDTVIWINNVKSAEVLKLHLNSLIKEMGGLVNTDLKQPSSYAEYTQLSILLDSLVDKIGDNPKNYMYQFTSLISGMVEQYDKENVDENQFG